MHIEAILRLMEEGLSQREIAARLGLTKGKVNYEWTRYRRQKAAETVREQALTRAEGAWREAETFRDLPQWERPGQTPVGAKRFGLDSAVLEGATLGRTEPADSPASTDWRFEEGELAFAFEDADALTALPRDATSLYVYWQLTGERKQMAERHFQCGWGILPKLLRIYDVNSIEFNGDNANSSFEVAVNDATDHWFIPNLPSDCSYVVDYGTKTLDGRFYPLVRSNSVRLPANRESV